jgi:hypothetical protein
MKSKLLLLLCIMLLTVATSFAQITATTSSVAIQGIARDDNGNARTNQQIPLTLKLYYKLNGTETAISTQTVSDATTDAFGVFSTLLDIDQSKYTILAGNQVFLRISGKDASGNQDVTISDQGFNQVPYAVVASNGSPTGSITAFVGMEEPIGWVLCDGKPLPTDGSAYALIALVGNNAPNLQGMFLRGTGGSGIHVGPTLNTVEQDAIAAHTPTVTDPTHGHGITDPGHGHGITDPGHGHGINDPKHGHKIVQGQYTNGNNGGQGGSSPNAGYFGAESEYRATGVSVVNGGTGISTIKGGTGISTIKGGTGISVTFNGNNETRPVSYGVNYIIKL